MEGPVSLDEIKLKPFDLLLFKGSDFVSKSIRFLEFMELGSAEWSHTGLVVNTDVLPDIKNGEKGKLYIWESTMSDAVKDIESGGTVLGVQIRPLEEAIKEYNKGEITCVGVCQLKNNPIDKKEDETIDYYESRMKAMRETLVAMHKSYYHRLYQVNVFRLVQALFPSMRKWDRDDEIDRVFCSELVGIIYKGLGILAIEVNPEDIVPMDLIGYDKDKNGVPKGLFNLPPIIVAKGQGL